MHIRYVIMLVVFNVHFCFGQQSKKVLIIGIDGCRPDALVAAGTPNIDALLDNSVYSFHAQNDDITFSGPGWSAMMTGVWSNKHGVTNNSFSGNNFTQYPHFITRVENFNPALRTISISQWAPINNFLAINADYTFNAANEAAVTSEAVNRLSSDNPDVMFIQFDDVDHEGHTSGFSKNNPLYITQIEEVDSQIGIIMNALHARPNYAHENWLILLSTDHGGINTSHGGNTAEEKTIFTIAHNKSFVKKQILPIAVVNPSNNCISQSKYLHFDSGADMVDIPNIPSYNFGSNTDFTVECRVRTSTPADIAFVTNKNWNSGVNKGFILSFKYPNGPEWKINVGDGTNRKDINTGGAITDGLWHHLAATFDRDGNISMYEDGVLKAVTAMAPIGNIDNGSPIRIGADINGNFHYTGYMQEIRIWNKVIGPAALNDWKCAAVNATHPDFASLVGYWPLNENAGSTANDFSLNNNDGIITSPVWQNSDTTFVFTNTPRTTDIAVTALDWLCIDILPEWQLDGHSIIESVTKVSSLTDNTPGSLRAVVLSTCPNDVITFDVMTDNAIQLVNSAEISIPHNLTISGNGAIKTMLSGEFMNRLFYISSPFSLTLRDLTLTKGNNSTGGGAFYNAGTTFLNNVVLKNNLENTTPKSFTNFGTLQVINLVELKE